MNTVRRKGKERMALCENARFAENIKRKHAAYFEPFNFGANRFSNKTVLPVYFDCVIPKHASRTHA